MECPTHPDDHISWAVWAVAGLLGVLGLAGWSLLKPIGFPGRAPEQDYPRVSYRPVIVDDNDLGHAGALQAVWTPILFSLPTRAGFSSPILERSGDLLPPAGLSEAASRVEAGPPQDWRRYMKESVGADIQKQIRHAQWKYLRQTERSPVLASAVPPGKRVEEECSIHWSGGISGAMILDKTVNLKGLGGGVRDAVLSVDISEDGIVDHVFVEQSSGDVEWDNRVVRRVRQWRATPAVTKRSGRLIVQSGRYSTGIQPEEKVTP